MAGNGKKIAKNGPKIGKNGQKWHKKKEKFRSKKWIFFFFPVIKLYFSILSLTASYKWVSKTRKTRFWGVRTEKSTFFGKKDWFHASDNWSRVRTHETSLIWASPPRNGGFEWFTVLIGAHGCPPVS